MGALWLQQLYRTIAWERMCVPRVVMWIQLNVWKTLDCFHPRYCAISQEILHVSCSSFANMIASLDSILTFHGLRAFTIATVVKLHVSRRSCLFIEALLRLDQVE
jgi:hypothetical protein